MCGIAGIVDHGQRFGPDRLREIAIEMRDILAHRGPDDAGVWVDPTGLCALSHRRLSILDLSPAGHQPMLDASGVLGLTFNGEIYNYRELKATLEAGGETFRTETDTEVLLRLVSGFRPDVLASIDGMYALGLWDSRTRRLLLARDAFGKKPLYVAEGPGWLAFASELSALRAVPGFEARINRDAVADYLLLQYVPAPRAIYEGSAKIPPGSWAILDFSKGAPTREVGLHYRWSPVASAAGRRGLPLERAADELRQVLLDAVSIRLRSDVPLGAFLSGGVDSGLVVAMITRELRVPIQTFSIGFEGFPDSEHVQARDAARHLQTTHHERILVPDAVDLLPRIAASLDEPLGDSSCLPTYLLSEFTRSRVTVALSGDGGDELFGGYSRYRATIEESRDLTLRLRHWLNYRRRWSPGRAYCSHRLLMFPPPELADLVAAPQLARIEETVAGWMAAIDDPGLPLVTRMQNLDASTYLPGAVLAKVDRMSMAYALEVRSPLLSRRVADFAATLPAEMSYSAGRTKPILRALAARYLPAQHVSRKKLGFGLPSGAWSKAEMLAMCDRLLLAEDSRAGTLLDPTGLRRVIERQRRPGGFSVFQIWTLLILELWLRAHEEHATGRWPTTATVSTPHERS